MNREEALSIVRDCLKPGHFRHSVGVAETAEKLALLWGADPEKAFLAGILHDYAKDMETHASDENARVEGILLHPQSIPQNGSSCIRTRWIDSDHTDFPTTFSQLRHEFSGEGTLAGTGASCDTDDVRFAGMRIDHLHELHGIRVVSLDMTDKPRNGTFVSGKCFFDQFVHLDFFLFYFFFIRDGHIGTQSIKRTMSMVAKIDRVASEGYPKVLISGGRGTLRIHSVLSLKGTVSKILE